MNLLFVCYVPLPCFFVINFLSFLPDIFEKDYFNETSELYPTFMAGLTVPLFNYLKGSNLLQELIFV